MGGGFGVGLPVQSTNVPCPNCKNFGRPSVPQSAILAVYLFDAAAIVALALVARNIGPIRGWLGERQVRSGIRESGLRSVHDFYCTDQAGVITQIDHLVHLGEAIAVIETKNISGPIYGRAHDKQWTRGWGKFRLRFQNPLRQNHRHVMTLRERFPGAAFEPLVVFTAGRFPKGRPEGVTTAQTLRAALTYIDRAPHLEKSPTDEAWAQIEFESATQTRLQSNAHRRQLDERFRDKGLRDGAAHKR